MALLLWASAVGARAQSVVPDQGAERVEGPDGLSAPAPRAAVPPPPPAYATARGRVAPIRQSAESEAAGRAQPTEGAERRAGSEMPELYIMSGVYTALATAYLLSIDHRIAEDETGFVVLGALVGPAVVLTVDLTTGGLPTGVPAAIGMGLLGGLVEAALVSNRFEGLVDTDPGILGLITASMTVGGAVGGVASTLLRPSVSDVRLVMSTAVWGLYFTLLGGLAFDVGDDTAATAELVAFNAGALIGVLLTPINDLSAGSVWLLHAGLGIGTAAGVMLTTLASSGSFDPQVIAAGAGAGALAGLVVTYLLVRPDDPDVEPAEMPAARASAPFVAPTVDGRGAVVGVRGVL